MVVVVVVVAVSADEMPDSSLATASSPITAAEEPNVVCQDGMDQTIKACMRDWYR